MRPAPANIPTTVTAAPASPKIGSTTIMSTFDAAPYAATATAPNSARSRL